MTRLIFLAIVVFAVVWLLRRAVSGGGPKRGNGADSAAPQGDLVSCGHCGVNLPKSEAYAAGGAPPGAGGSFYCSEEHRRLGSRDG